MARAATAIRRVTRVMAAISGLAIVALMLLTVADVARRELTGSGIAGTIELTEVVLVAAVFAALAAAEADRTHVRTPVLINLLRGRGRETVRLLGLAAALAIVVWMAWLTLDAGIESAQAGEYRFGLRAIPVWPAKLLIPIGLACMALELLVELVETAGRAVRSPA